MSAKDDLLTAMQNCADTSGDLDLRVGFGAPGARILVRGETKETGQAYFVPGYIDCLFEAIGEVIEGGANFYEEEFVAAIAGDQDFTLSANPKSNANSLSGYAIQGVYRDGSRLRYRASPSSNTEYGFTAPNQLNCQNLLIGDVIMIVYFGE